jgi:ubiquitin
VNYAADLAKVMKKIVLLSNVAALAKEIEEEDAQAGDTYTERTRHAAASVTHDKVTVMVNEFNYDDEEGNETLSGEQTFIGETPYVIDPEEKKRLTGALTDAQRTKIIKLLGAWEEPEKAMGIEVRKMPRHLL